MDIDHGRDRPQRIVGRHADAERVAERRDAPDLGQAAGMADVRLGDRDRLRLQERQELAPMGEPLARGDRNRGRARDARRSPSGSSGWQGSSRKNGRKGSRTFAYWIAIAALVRPCRSTMMSMSSPAPSRAAAISRSAPLSAARPSSGAVLPTARILDRREPVGARSRRLLGERFRARVVIDRRRVAAAEMIVHAQPVAREPAEQLP